MDRRRFLALGATTALVLTGCVRVGSGEATSPAPTGPPAGERDPDPSGRHAEPVEEPATGGSAAERGASEVPAEEPPPEQAGDLDTDGGTEPDPEPDPELLEAAPSEWGERVTGVGTRLADTSAIALTLDACGGPNGSGYDAALIDHLRAAEVPATLFVNQRWLDANPEAFAELDADPLFEIENHGTAHRPLSVTGRSAYGITGTGSAEEVVEEVLGCQRRLTELTGRAPRFFRSGTAHYDDVAVRIVRSLGLEVAGYSVLGDAGATFSAGQVRDALLGAGPGAVVLLHMNHPASGTAEGVAQALPTLLDRGRVFSTLGAHGLA